MRGVAMLHIPIGGPEKTYTKDIYITIPHIQSVRSHYAHLLSYVENFSGFQSKSAANASL